MLKFLFELSFRIDKKLFELEKQTSKSLYKLDGFLLGSQFKDLYNQIMLLKEIVNNNEIEGIHSTYINMLYTINELGSNNKNDLTTFYNIEAINQGIEFINRNNFISKNQLVKIQQIIRNNKDEIRRITGTVIKNANNEIVYTPPQGFDLINDYLDELEHFINDSQDFDNFKNLSPFLKLPIIHYQFEAIHPFNDGNGRTGRILVILYLILKKEIENPIFALSYYINQNKKEYYHLLNGIHQKDDNLNDFIRFMLVGIEQSSIQGIQVLKDLANIFNQIYELKFSTKVDYKQKLSMFNKLIFGVEWFADLIDISLNTARKHLKSLVNSNILIELKKGNKKRYCFSKLVEYINQM